MITHWFRCYRSGLQELGKTANVPLWDALERTRGINVVNVASDSLHSRSMGCILVKDESLWFSCCA